MIEPHTIEECLSAEFLHPFDIPECNECGACLGVDPNNEEHVHYSNCSYADYYVHDRQEQELKKWY